MVMRRTQAERREATRAALVQATIAALIEVGYAKTTTTEVCRRAGVSQGALFKHFATKGDLVAGAAEELFSELIVDYRSAFDGADAGEHRIEAAIALLWEVFRQPRLRAAYELYVAAATDPELAAAMRPVVIRHGDHLQVQARDLFPEVGDDPDFSAAVEVVIFAIQGATLQAPVVRDPEFSALRSRLVEATTSAYAEARTRLDAAAQRSVPSGTARTRTNSTTRRKGNE